MNNDCVIKNYNIKITIAVNFCSKMKTGLKLIIRLQNTTINFLKIINHDKESIVWSSKNDDTILQIKKKIAKKLLLK